MAAAAAKATAISGDGSSATTRRLERAKHQVAILEQMLEDKTRDLYLSNLELRSANEFMEDVFESMAGGLVVVGQDGTIERVNRRLLALLGSERDEIVGQEIRAVLPHAGTYVANGVDGAQEDDTEMRRQDGTSIPVALTNGELRRQDGSAGHIYVALDIRPRKEVEKKLADANQKLVRASREAGRAEVATGIIHNIGNVLTGVNLGTEWMTEQINESKLSSLDKLVELLEAHDDDLPTFFASPKGAKIPAFLRSLRDALFAERDQLAHELDTMKSRLSHIASVVNAQQRFATGAVALEVVDLRAAVSEAAQLVSHRLKRSGAGLRVEGPDPVEIRTDRGRVVQILANLISNAADAIRDADKRNASITINLRTVADDIELAVRDEGIGMSPATLTKVFQHGFTTKTDGHGFGLHSAANQATELGGTLTAESDGVGLGSTMRLRIPRGVATP